MHGREAHAGADDVHDLTQVFFRRLVVYAGGQRRLIDAYMAHGVHEQIGEIVGRVAPFAGHAAHAHVHEGLVAGEELGAAFAGKPHHFRHLDQHTAGEIEGFIIGHAACVDIGAVERIHVLVHAAYGHTGLVLFHRQQGFHSPHGLNGFPEAAGSVSGNAGVDFGNLQKFCLALGVALFGGQFRRVFGHAASVDHHAFGGVDDRFVEVDLVQIIGIFVNRYTYSVRGLRAECPAYPFSSG